MLFNIESQKACLIAGVYQALTFWAQKSSNSIQAQLDSLGNFFQRVELA